MANFDRSQEELKRSQWEDVNSTYTNYGDGESHITTSDRFFDVFQQSTAWARDYFKIPFHDFKIGNHKRFEKSLERVMCEGGSWANKKRMNVSHLVEAVVADLLVSRILQPQFAGCSESARHEFGRIFDVMLKGKPYLKDRADLRAGLKIGS